MDISQRDLQVFLALAEEKSFTRAAAKCHLSQSAFSSRIRLLEIGLRTTLFDRTTRSVELTNDGRLFEISAQQLYKEFSQVLENFQDHAARRKGSVKIATLPSLCSSWLPTVLAQFRARYPGIELSVIDDLSEVCLDLLRSGQVDLAINSMMNTVDDLQATAIGTDQFHLVCPTGHPLLRVRHISAEELVKHPFILQSRRSSVRQHIESAVRPFTLRTSMEVHYMATIAGMVGAGLGLSIVPGLSLWQFERPGLSSRPLKLPHLARPIHLLKRRGYSLSAAASALFDHIAHEKSSLLMLARKGSSKPDAR
ncbi:MAG: LysR family transcriptional regulator [Proteobacteria bacterium]|nr:LysR family transcriptional regulator [Pseudomonadota bacterium]